MKKRTVWRNLLIFGVWLVVGVVFLALLMPSRRLGSSDDAAQTNADVPPLDVSTPSDDAPAPHFYVSESTTAGSAAPSINDSGADNSPSGGPMLAAPGAAAPDLPGEPAPNEPGESAGDDEATADTASPNAGSVGDADAIGEAESSNDPLQSASSPDSYGTLGSIGSGEGGGGSGEGIGLDNIGTIGHGGATVEGYGSGRGGAAAHPQTQEIVVDESAKPPLPPDATISASDDAMSEVDRKLAALPLGNIAFNTPETIPLGGTAAIELLVSMKEAEDVLRSAVHGSGPVESANALLADQMEAKVTGLGFRIEPITPERQAVSHTQETRWRWQIEPTKSDTLELNLTLSAIIKIEGEPIARTIRTFEKTIVVKVPFGQRLTTAVSNNFELLTTVILIPVAGGTWRYVRKRKRVKPAPEDDTEAPRRAA